MKNYQKLSNVPPQKTFLWTQISKKEFIETLSNNKTILASNVFRQSDEKCINAMEKITTLNNAKRSNYIVFSAGGRPGTIQYFSYTNAHGIHFLIQKIEGHNCFDGEFYSDKIVYAML